MQLSQAIVFFHDVEYMLTATISYELYVVGFPALWPFGIVSEGHTLWDLFDVLWMLVSSLCAEHHKWDKSLNDWQIGSSLGITGVLRCAGCVCWCRASHVLFMSLKCQLADAAALAGTVRKELLWKVSCCQCTKAPMKYTTVLKNLSLPHLRYVGVSPSTFPKVQGNERTVRAANFILSSLCSCYSDVVCTLLCAFTPFYVLLCVNVCFCGVSYTEKTIQPTCRMLSLEERAPAHTHTSTQFFPSLDKSGEQQ